MTRFNRLLATLLGAALALTAQARVVRVLAIGNSFSEDAVEQNLYQLALAQGDTLIIGNAYIGGCSIDRHLENLRHDSAAYIYRKITDGVRVSQKPLTLKAIINDEPWDIVSLQQASPLSGRPESFINLPLLKATVLSSVAEDREEPLMVWHMTWAYAKDYKSDHFKYYDNDQQKMYDAIVSTMCQELPRAEIGYFIPSGIAIQNARELMGDVMCRDGFHLSLTLGRYTAACAWCEFLTGRNVYGNDYWPPTISMQEARTLQLAAHEAFTNGLPVPCSLPSPPEEP